MGKNISDAERARRAGLSPTLVWNRINIHGWSRKRAFSTPVKKAATTYAFLAKLAGVDPATIRYRLRHGLPAMAPKKVYPLASALHEGGLPGLDRQRVWARVKSGWSLEEAISTPIIANVPRSSTKNALKTRKYSSRCRNFVSTLLRRPVSKLDAFEIMKDMRDTGILPTETRWTGVKTIAEDARRYGINPAIVRQRIKRNGWSKRRALSTPVLPPHDDTLSHRARAAGLKPALVHQRIKREGWSEARALSTPVRKVNAR